MSIPITFVRADFYPNGDVTPLSVTLKDRTVTYFISKIISYKRTLMGNQICNRYICAVRENGDQKSGTIELLLNGTQWELEKSDISFTNNVL